MQAAPRVASSTGRRSPAGGAALLSVRTVLAYAADMVSTVRERADRSQSGFGADLLEALTACVELINTGRSAAGGDLSLPDVESFGHRYAFHGTAAEPRDVPRCGGNPEWKSARL